METAGSHGVAPCDSFQLRNRNPTMNTHDNSIRVRVPALSIPDIQARRRKTNEGASLNLSGREVVDGANRGNKLMNSKKYLQIGTLNVRTLNLKTLRKKEKRLEMANNFNKCKLNILGIVDYKYETQICNIFIQ